MKKRLKDITDFAIGYQFRGKVRPDQAGAVRVVQIKDIDDDLQIRVTDLVSVNVERPEPYLIKRGDVLFLSRGHRLYAVVVPEVMPNTIATGYFFILRPRDYLVVPEYLAWSMNDAAFQDSLRPYLRGSHMPMVSKADIEGLRIYLPPLDVQQRVLMLNHLLNQERRLSTAIHERRSLLVQAVSRNLITGQLTVKGNQP